MADSMDDSDEPLFHREENSDLAIVEFAAASVAVLEKDGRAVVKVRRRGNMSKRIIFK